MNRSEKAHLDAVAGLGCIVCRNIGHGHTPALVHHINTGGTSLRAPHFLTIPLCPYHHQTGPFGEAVHNGKRTFEANFGTELALLGQVQALLEMGETA